MARTGKPHVRELQMSKTAKLQNLTQTPRARELQPIFAESQFLVSTAANPTRASCTYSSGGNISTAGSGKPHERELHLAGVQFCTPQQEGFSLDKELGFWHN